MSQFTKNESPDDDEVVIVELPRSSVKILKEVVRREEAYNWFHNKMKNWWIITAATIVIILFTFAEKAQDFLQYWSVK